MKTTHMAMLLGGAALIATLTAGDRALTTAKADAPGPARIDNFLLADQNLVAHELYRVADAPAVVLISQTVADKTTGAAADKLAADYGAKGVEVWAIDPSQTDTMDQIVAATSKSGQKVPVLMDDRQVVGESLGVTRSGEAFVVNPKTWQVVW